MVLLLITIIDIDVIAIGEIKETQGQISTINVLKT